MNVCDAARRFVRSKLAAYCDRCLIACLLACSAASMIGEQASARTLVLHASGPSASKFLPGQVLAEPLFVRLEKGDSLHVLDVQGTRELKGPKTIDDRKMRKLPVRRLPSWEALVGVRTTTAATRGYGSSPSTNVAMPSTLQNQIWAVDVAAPGHWCAAAESPLSLWRSTATAELSVKLTGASGSSTVTFRKGDKYAAWREPANSSGDRSYSIESEAGSPTTIWVHTLAPAETTTELAQQFVRRGCYQQLAILLDN